MILVGVILACCIAPIVWYALEFVRTHSSIERWAKENDLKLLDLKIEPRGERKWPWDAKGTIVYRVWVRDRTGQDRCGLLRRQGRGFDMWFDGAWVANTQQQPTGFPVMMAAKDAGETRE